MGNEIAEKLKEIKIDYSAYGELPIREDAYLIEARDEEGKKNKVVFKQWEKLNYIRKNLKILDRYIKSGTTEKLGEWLKKNNSNMSDVVLSKIGDHNNETGGISAYFFNLQKFYDDEELRYDTLEANANVPGDFADAVKNLRKDRQQKRGSRSKSRKLFMREMQLDGKGYLVVEQKMPNQEEVFSATGEKTTKEQEQKTEQKSPDVKPDEATKKAGEEIKKKSKNIGIYIAGTVIFITAAIAIASSTTESK